MKNNEKNESKKIKPNKYQVAAKIGELGKKSVLPVCTFAIGIIGTAAVGKIKIKK